ncbi:MAG TPA: glycosyltransferase [Thermoguttaceae bacterium]|nr:glycosyltransferase [Thermoguttaceae bacterium]
MNVPETILIAYVFLGCVYWLRQAVGAVRIVRAVPVLAEIDPPEPPVWPKLSVIIPACNEAETIETAAATVLRQAYPNLEIILVDDRSDDGTGEIIDRIAAGDDRVRALHVTELPDGWLGKVHALKCGLEHAAGRWVLFSDADVHLSGDVLRRVVAYCEHRRMDHLAAAPDMWSTTFLVDVAVAMFLRSFCVFMRCWAIEDPRSTAFIGVGAFNLVRRSALEKTPGFEWLKLEVADDVGLGMMLKRCGARCCMVNARGLVGLHWYPSVAHMARGMEKAFASAAHCRVVRLLAICALTAGLELAPLAAFIPLGHRGLWPAGVAMIASAVLSIVVLARWTRGRVLPGLFFPLGALLNTALLLRAGWLGLRRGGIVWRGTLYRSRVLRQGIRVRFP